MSDNQSTIENDIESCVQRNFDFTILKKKKDKLCLYMCRIFVLLMVLLERNYIKLQF